MSCGGHVAADCRITATASRRKPFSRMNKTARAARPITSALLPDTRAMLRHAHSVVFLSQDRALAGAPAWRVLDAVLAWALAQQLDVETLVKQRMTSAVEADATQPRSAVEAGGRASALPPEGGIPGVGDDDDDDDWEESDRC